MAIFVVTRTQGAGWDAARAPNKQDDWAGHAEMLDQMHDDGFVIYAGPLVGTNPFQAMLVVRAESQQDVRDAFSEDPWVLKEITTISSIVEWNVRLGEMPE